MRFKKLRKVIPYLDGIRLVIMHEDYSETVKIFKDISVVPSSFDQYVVRLVSACTERELKIYIKEENTGNTHITSSSRKSVSDILNETPEPSMRPIEEGFVFTRKGGKRNK